MHGIEKDPLGKSPKEKGSKLDAGKCLTFQGLVEYFPLALKAVAEVSTFGANKYTVGGWRLVPNGQKRYADAEMRHKLARASGELYDVESKLLHQTHEVWNALAALELYLTSTE